MGTLAMKSFSIADVVKSLAFNVPVVERTAPCRSCWYATPVKDLKDDGICRECHDEHEDQVHCDDCGGWFFQDDMANDYRCETCQRDWEADLRCHQMIEDR
jgi:predicted Zn-ribbon and HTH transcriptional regulator